MATIIKEIEVDVSQLNRFAAIVAKQYDKQSRFLKVTLLDSGERIKVESASTAVINARREDKVAKTFEGKEMMKDGICTAIGVVGSVIASLFGGWDAALVTLVIFMAIDYVTGLLVAGVFHNSGKTENGALESRAGWKGLCRKCITLLMVLVATRLDLVTGTNFIRDAVVIAFIANETISIVENAGLMGINIPPAITSAIEVLKKKSDSVDNTDQ